MCMCQPVLFRLLHVFNRRSDVLASILLLGVGSLVCESVIAGRTNRAMSRGRRPHHTILCTVGPEWVRRCVGSNLDENSATIHNINKNLSDTNDAVTCNPRLAGKDATSEEGSNALLDNLYLNGSEAGNNSDMFDDSDDDEKKDDGNMATSVTMSPIPSSRANKTSDAKTAIVRPRRPPISPTRTWSTTSSGRRTSPSRTRQTQSRRPRPRRPQSQRRR
ncbi:hypothetical protein BDU57DRAFT_113953 [Ampelomyces quisqualis]|uniref:Uncharacterized protein n=1 Tax=Ampelomyces quisqualis TaxID=50730 RepID=A0A6A5Q5N2_AMPQU|nr:hypothetical protein BDU57DRAFT_113953 [Ampelomyces quisqualis]